MKKKRFSEIKLLWSIVKRCNFEKFLFGFLICFFLGALLVAVREPSIHTSREGLWYCFVSCTSIGFGDFVAVTPIGRTVTVILTIYEIMLVALMSGVVVSHYIEVIHAREKMSATVFVDKLEHLSELDHDELVDLENRVKKLTSR